MLCKRNYFQKQIQFKVGDASILLLIPNGCISMARQMKRLWLQIALKFQFCLMTNLNRKQEIKLHLGAIHLSLHQLLSCTMIYEEVPSSLRIYLFENKCIVFCHTPSQTRLSLYKVLELMISSSQKLLENSSSDRAEIYTKWPHY